MNSGGFDSYFRYWAGNTAPEALAVLPTVLGPAWGDLLTEAMALIGTPYPVDIDVREARADEDGVEDALNLLDERYYDLENTTDADGLLADFAQRQVGDWP